MPFSQVSYHFSMIFITNYRIFPGFPRILSFFKVFQVKLETLSKFQELYDGEKF